MAEPQRIPFTCTLDCGARCELVAVVQDGELLRIDTPPNQPDPPEMPRLVPCVRGRAHRRLVGARERVGTPLRRTGARGSGEFVAIPWEEALDEVAGRLSDLAARNAHQELLLIMGAGSGGGRGFSGAGPAARFFSFWGPVTATTGNMSNHNASIAAQWMLGRVVPGSDRVTLADSKLIILWGNNPAETHMAPNTPHFIATARDRGARVVLIDPRYSDTAVLADEWVPIRPGTDAALVAAMAWVMETEGLVDRAFVETHTTGYQHYRDYLLGRRDGVAKTPAWAEGITGVPAETTIRLAREYAIVKPACLYAGWAPQRTAFGEQPARAFVTLACMSGNVGLRGGGAASVGGRGSLALVGGMPRGYYGQARQLSNTTWAADVLGGALQPPPSMAYIVASNVVNRSPHTLANIAALERIGFVVVHEPYMTPTARCADLVLPINTDLERRDVISGGYQLFDAGKAVETHDAARSDYWVMSRLAERLGLADAYMQGRDEAAWVTALLGEAGLDEEALRRQGVLRRDPPARVELDAFRADPVANPLDTPSGKIELANPQAASFGLPVVAEYVASPGGGADYPLQLVTPHSEVRANSCLHANAWLQRAEPVELWLSQADAQARGIAPGERVEVFNGQGVVRVPVYVTARIMPGVVCLPQGAWYAPAADGADEGGDANVLTPLIASPTGGTATHSAWVQVRRAGA